MWHVITLYIRSRDYVKKQEGPFHTRSEALNAMMEDRGSADMEMFNAIMFYKPNEEVFAFESGDLVILVMTP